MSTLNDYIARLPKAELHVHIEGTFEPELMFAIAQRNQIAIPYASVEELKKAYDFSNLQDFLDIYYAGAQALQHEQDFYDLTWAYLEKLAAEEVIHAEIFFDPQTHTDRGIPFKTVMDGIGRACADGREKLGLSLGLILCFLRHLDEDSALQTFEASLPYRDMILGYGLDSSEVGHPPSKFTQVFNKVRAEGFKIVAHAGEEGPPAYIWEALDILNVDRIDHGNRCLEDDALVAEIIKRDLALTVCPLSNLKLCVVNDMKDHPLKTMLNKGLKATVNSDDPAYFGGLMNANFESVAAALDLTKDDLYTLARNSFEASFLPESEKAALIGKLDAYHQQH